ncbi:Uu.00g060500.m01.CDS01 [Anthostomella pinea]|uniref:Uu.00g060500.m01.CDS01 n=1 Tax=Anthostomella pinea TaxID=933095 RepID=A0AAI8VLP9_9PEZI|nr:Uu.00g060500.m01.CDS01 [Anthostomella pinea]
MAPAGTRPASREEADAHIAAIRAKSLQHSTDVDDPVISSLQNALLILSQQKCPEPIQILRELIYNADDNNHSPKPCSISFHLEERSDEQHILHVEYNEDGFSLEDVTALCALGKPRNGTRVPRKRKARNGEKGGTGFKSVFHVANIVEIHSGHFHFKFDCSTTLGALVPINLEPMRTNQEGAYTRISLYLDSKTIYDTFLTELNSFDNKTLLLLNFDRLTIQTESRHTLHSTTFGLKGPPGRVISITEQDFLTGKLDTSRYIFFDEIIEVIDTRFGFGFRKIHLVAAFPWLENRPLATPQSTYTFLPMGSFGWKFIIHGNFLLNPHDGRFENGNKWNSTIISHIRELVVQSIQTLADTGVHRYWYRWLGGDFEHGEVWNTIHDNILTGLKD